MLKAVERQGGVGGGGRGMKATLWISAIKNKIL